MTVSLAANALTELAAVKTELGITGSSDDDYLNRAINAASDFVEAYCGRVFYWDDDITEALKGFGDYHLVVSRKPLDTIIAITYDGSTVDSGNYEIHDADAGIIFAPGRWNNTAYRDTTPTQDPIEGTNRKLYSVNYKAGYVTPKQETDDPTLTRNLPWSLEQACIDLVTAQYRSKGSDKNIKSERLMSWSVVYGDQAIPPSIKTVLDSYMVIGFA